MGLYKHVQLLKVENNIYVPQINLLTSNLQYDALEDGDFGCVWLSQEDKALFSGASALEKDT